MESLSLLPAFLIPPFFLIREIRRIRGFQIRCAVALPRNLIWISFISHSG